MTRPIFYFLLLMLSVLLFSFNATGQTKDQKSTSPDTIISPDKGWPRTVETEDATVIFHQPQVFKWENFETVGVHIATEIYATGKETDPIIGTVTAEAKTDIDFETRAILIYDKDIINVQTDNTDSNFIKVANERLQSLQTSPEIISLDRVLPMIDDSIFETKGVETNNEPPEIFFTKNQNSILVIFDGEPIWTPTGRDMLKFAVNTNWPVFRYEKDEQLFLLNEGMWLTSKSIKGPWVKTTDLPKDFKKLSKSEKWKDLQKVVPAKKTEKEAPVVFTSTQPAELLVFTGAPKFKSIEKTDGLKSVYNTDADVFFFENDGKYYFLVSGRWFKASTLEGPWEFASDKLPEAFSMIPEDSDWGKVLSSIPGTIQAKEAAIQAMLPQKAELSRDATAPDVKYDGEPKFEAIEGTDMKYATNTQHDIVYVDNNYYMCYQGAWFVSAYPTYGWSVCYTVHPSIYTIPPYCPIYHVSYVRCYGYSATHVTFGYSAGYMGVHVSFGVPFYGTGYYYSPYYHYPAHYGYPMYYPYHHSYGCRATYNPYTGTYGRQARVYGPYGGAGRGAYYNPRTGTYARGRSAWGPYNGAGEAIAYNPRTGRTAATRQGYNTYSSWGESVVAKGDKWAHTGHYTDRNGTRYAFETSEGAKGVGFKSNDGKSGRVVKSKEGDLYVGGNGNGVFKKDGNDWYRRNGSDWNKVQRDNRPSISQSQKDNAKNTIRDNKPKTQNTRPQVFDKTRTPNKTNANFNRSTLPTRDYNARQRGNYRTNNYNNYQRQSNSNFRSRSSSSGGLKRRRN